MFHFRATCLKIVDLYDAKKLDRFVRALMPDIPIAGGDVWAEGFS